MALFHTTVLDNQIKALPTVGTASGSVATFDTDLTENLIEVKCQIVAQQGGSGTPSPDNQRPIITYNQLNLAHIGNTDKMSWLQGVTSGIYGIVDLGSLSWNPDANRTGVFYTPSARDAKVSGAIITKDYIWRNLGVPSPEIIADYNKEISLYPSYGSPAIYVIDHSFDGMTGAQVKTALSGVYAIYELATPTFPMTYTASDFNAMLADFGIDGSLYNIPFGQTVANGVLDVTTGKLRVTHGVVDMGSLTWTYNNSDSYAGNPYFNSGLISDCKINSALLCSHYAFKSGGRGSIPNDSISMWNTTTSKTFAVRNDSYTDPMIFKTDMSGVIVVYELETPIEIQLDSITLQALLNENNIWCDTGDTSVKYILSVGKAIS